MTDHGSLSSNLPPEQEAIRAKCFHPTGTFVEFRKDDTEQSIPERFEEIVRKFPNRIAVESKESRVTYDALNSAANHLARGILALRGEGQEPVALLLEHGLSPIIAHLAVLKAGKISLQLDPFGDSARTAHILEDAQATLMLTNAKNASRAREWVKTNKQIINIDELDSNLGEENPGLSIPPDVYAYIRYTSGSTGKAKGAVKTHRHVLHAVMNLTNDFRISFHDRAALLGRDLLGKHTFEALLNGAAVCLFNVKEDGLVHLGDWLVQKMITFCKLFPTAFRHFVFTLTGTEKFPELRLIRLEGEPLYKKDIDLYKKHFSAHCLLVNSFSTTETGTICVYFIDKNTEIYSHRIPVGYPVKGKEVLLLDESGKEVGFDQPGEVAVQSRFLASGYWKKPDLTKEKFLAEPEGGQNRVYLTGDLAQRSRDGCIDYLGRKDFQLKIRSFRVDLGDVEAAIADHPQVKEIAVMAKEDRSGNARLVAYFVPHNRPAPTTNLREFLQDKLPDYMIPSAFVVLDELPVVSTGKLDRRVLTQLRDERPAVKNSYVPPQTLAEEELVKIWAEVLSLQRVGIHDNFFELGGHSLAATQLVSQVMKTFHVELPLPSLFEAPTVAEMAVVIAQNQANEARQEEVSPILTELEALSDEEAGYLLTQEMRGKSVDSPRWKRSH